MGKRKSKYVREEIKVTEKWVYKNVHPRITKRDIKILEFIREHRIVKREHIEEIFWKDAKNKTYLADRRLRFLYDMHCIDRRFPRLAIGEGTAQQHIILDRAGAILLELEKFYKIQELPSTYKHTVKIVDLYVKLINKFDVTKWNTKVQISNVRPDIYAILDGKDIFFEIDTGTESYKTLTNKIRNYSNIDNLPPLVFVTIDSKARKEHIIEQGDKYDVGIDIWTF